MYLHLLKYTILVIHLLVVDIILSITRLHNEHTVRSPLSYNGKINLHYLCMIFCLRCVNMNVCNDSVLCT